jgi:C4-dicarboxylate transporter DctM subunit
MNENLIGLLGIVILLILIFIRLPIGFAMALIGFVGFAILSGTDVSLNMVGVITHSTVVNYSFIVVPLFLLMGNFAASSRITKDLYDAAFTWLGHNRGGLAAATTVACGGFAAICGSSMATATAMGKVALPEMERYNYDTKLAAGCIAAGGTVGILIPPSMGFVLYAILTEQSVGHLFMAGIFPGILEVVFYVLVIYFLCLRNPSLGPAGPRTSFKAKLVSLKNIWAMLVLFLLVIGGIYMGIFTPTEAAGVGAVGALLISMVARRLTRQGFIQAVSETGQYTAMVFILVIGAMIFTRFLAVSQLPYVMAEMIGAIELNRYFILIGILIFYIIIGCFLDIFASLILTMPILFPTIVALGFHPVWFGVLFVRVAEIGMITPPFGMLTFILSGVTRIPVGTIFRGIVPFIIADFFHVALLVAVPQISLFLPETMRAV